MCFGVALFYDLKVLCVSFQSKPTTGRVIVGQNLQGLNSHAIKNETLRLSDVLTQQPCPTCVLCKSRQKVDCRSLLLWIGFAVKESFVSCLILLSYLSDSVESVSKATVKL